MAPVVLDVGVVGYSGNIVIDVAEDLLRKAFRGKYPVELVLLKDFVNPEIPERINSSRELVALLWPMVSELEDRIENVKKIGA